MFNTLIKHLSVVLAMVREEQQHYCSTIEPKAQCGALGGLSMVDVLGPPVVCYIHLATCIQIWISVYIYIYVYKYMIEYLKEHILHI